MPFYKILTAFSHIYWYNKQALVHLEIWEVTERNLELSIGRECHNYTPQTNTGNRKEEAKSDNRNTTFIVREPVIGLIKWLRPKGLKVCSYVEKCAVYMCFVVTCWERAGHLALVCGVYCEFVTFPFVSWVRCGTWLYRFLIFASLLTFKNQTLKNQLENKSAMRNRIPPGYAISQNSAKWGYPCRFIV